MFYYKNTNKKKRIIFAKKSNIKNLILYSIFLLSVQVYGQSSIGLKITGPGFHSEWDQDPAMFENKMTKDGSVIMEPGYELNFQKFIYLTNISIEVRQGIHSDAAAKMAGHFGIGLRWKFFHLKRSTISISLSPIYAYRENWNRIPQYVDDGIYVNNEEKQYKFLLGSELVYNLFIGKRSDISFALIYNNSYNTLTLGLGYRFWINPYSKISGDKCNSCGKRWEQGKFRKWWHKVWR
jgi:hypothetical protein